MAEFLIQGNTLTAIANAIREKTNTTGTLTPEAMASKISEISASGGGDGKIQDVATEDELNAKLTSSNLGKAYRYTGTVKNKFIPGDIYLVEEL